MVLIGTSIFAAVLFVLAQVLIFTTYKEEGSFRDAPVLMIDFSCCYLAIFLVIGSFWLLSHKWLMFTELFGVSLFFAGGVWFFAVARAKWNAIALRGTKEEVEAYHANLTTYVYLMFAQLCISYTFIFNGDFKVVALPRIIIYALTFLVYSADSFLKG